MWIFTTLGFETLGYVLYLIKAIGIRLGMKLVSSNFSLARLDDIVRTHEHYTRARNSYICMLQLFSVVSVQAFCIETLGHVLWLKARISVGVFGHLCNQGFIFVRQD